MADTTTVRISRDTRERLRGLEQKLGLSTSEALARAIDALDRDLLWAAVAEYYEESPDQPPEDTAWVHQVGRAQG